jgi:hypothetical protein
MWIVPCQARQVGPHLASAVADAVAGAVVQDPNSQNNFPVTTVACGHVVMTPRLVLFG